jgi:hypothetical protein
MGKKNYDGKNDWESVNTKRKNKNSIFSVKVEFIGVKTNNFKAFISTRFSIRKFREKLIRIFKTAF